MKNITQLIKKAISVDTLWSVSDFYYFLEVLNGKHFKISHWVGEENWATLADNNTPIGYIWQKYPLIFIKEDYADEISTYIKVFCPSRVSEGTLLKRNGLSRQ